MDAHVYDMLFEHRQAELEREAALRRLAHELRAARRALRHTAGAAEPEPLRRPAFGGLRPAHDGHV
ncbi:hypothetical protein GCM10009809_36700 [Isoptericola hypogeus]|uniref:Uncharacterized protein n=1 Tax=Isoptericola hypogeus TaxID=300179 RepID=A0ABP4VUA4_9MICO